MTALATESVQDQFGLHEGTEFLRGIGSSVSDLSSIIITHETGTVIYRVHGFACIVTRDPQQLEEALAERDRGGCNYLEGEVTNTGLTAGKRSSIFGPSARP